MFQIIHCLFLLSDLDGPLVDLFQIFIGLFIPVTHQNVSLRNKNPSQQSWKNFWPPPTPLQSITLPYLIITFQLKEVESKSTQPKELPSSCEHHFILQLQ